MPPSSQPRVGFGAGVAQGRGGKWDTPSTGFGENLLSSSLPQLALDSFTPSLFALGHSRSEFRLRAGKQVSEDTCTPHIWPLTRGERGAGSCLQLPGRRYLALCRSSPARRVTAAVCCQPNAASPLLRGSLWDPNLGLGN